MKYKTLKIVTDVEASLIYFDEEDFPGPYLEGYTVGCQGCCNERKNVSEKELDTHISSLEKALSEAREIKKTFFN